MALWFKKKPKPDPCCNGHREILNKLEVLLRNQQAVSVNVNELQAQFDEIKAGLTEGLGEINTKMDELNTKIASLEQQLSNATIPDGAATTLAEVKTLALSIKDLIPQPPPA